MKKLTTLTLILSALALSGCNAVSGNAFNVLNVEGEELTVACDARHEADVVIQTANQLGESFAVLETIPIVSTFYYPVKLIGAAIFGTETTVAANERCAALAEKK